MFGVRAAVTWSLISLLISLAVYLGIGPLLHYMSLSFWYWGYGIVLIVAIVAPHFILLNMPGLQRLKREISAHNMAGGIGIGLALFLFGWLRFEHWYWESGLGFLTGYALYSTLVIGGVLGGLVASRIRRQWGKRLLFVAAVLAYAAGLEYLVFVNT